MTIAVAQMKVRAGQPAQNVETMLRLIAAARQQGAELALFPELCIPGLLIGDLAASEAFRSECRAADARIAEAATDIIVVYGNLEYRDGALHNVVRLAYNQQNSRLSVPMGGSFITGAYNGFAAARNFQTYPLPLDGKVYRTGFLLGDWRGDALPYAGQDVDLLVDLSCKPLVVTDERAQPRLAGRPYVSVNCYGLQNSGKANYLFAGGSFYSDADGALLARADAFAEGLYFWQRRGGALLPAPAGAALTGRALSVGVGEFLSLINGERAVIGISGGIDSALAACVYTQALGPENVWLISMPTRFNSAATKSLAAEMADALGTNYALLPVEASCNALAEQLSAAAYRTAAGGAARFSLSSAALENVQARDRLRVLAAVAASVGGVFTCNGNKAELSVGYATFYGDLGGAFAAQADLWKHQVYEASAYYQNVFPDAPLDRIAAIRPSAELSAEQDVTKGLGDPLIYRYHDHLLRAFVERGADPSVILACYQAGTLEKCLGCADGLAAELFPTPAAFIRDCEYWWRMYRGIGVAKRIQAPPLLALSARPFGEEKPQIQAGAYYSAAYQRLKQELLS